MEAFQKVINFENIIFYALKDLQYLSKIFSDSQLPISLYCLISQKLVLRLRKYFRVIDSAKILISVFYSHHQSFTKISAIIRFIFNICDHILLLRAYTFKRAKFVKHAAKFRNILWVLECVLSVITNSYKSIIIKGKLQSMVKSTQRDNNFHSQYSEKKSEYEKIVKKDENLTLKIVAKVFDLPLAVYSCEGVKINSLYSSIMGIISASIMLVYRLRSKS